MKHLLTMSLITVAALVLTDTAAAQATVTGPVSNDGGCADTWAGNGALINNLNQSSSTDCAGVQYLSTEGVANTAFGDVALLNNTTGSFNVAIGPYAAYGITSGEANVAIGYAALTTPGTVIFNTAVGHDAMEFVGETSSYNVAIGPYVLLYNDGQNNVAIGFQTMISNTDGYNDTAVGTKAMWLNTTGFNNTALGNNALYSNTTGNRDNAIGEGALQANTTANDNNAMGVNALTDNTTGSLNNAVGNFAMEYSTSGNNNNAMGYGALLRNTTGSDNSAQGYEALAGNTSGNLNIGVGYKAGSSLTTGSNNIDIGNVGVAAEAGKIRIGTQGTQSAAFIAGVAGTNISGGAAVVVSSSGQLGVVSSSRRYKEDIQPMGAASERLYQLKPVTFRYKQPEADGQKPVQVGLIAEDVAAVMPELVVYNQDGQPESVAYHLLPTLLLNEAQKQHQALQQARDVIQAQNRTLEDQTRQLKSQDERLAALQAQMTDVETMRAELIELRHITANLAAVHDGEGTKAAPTALVAKAN